MTATSIGITASVFGELKWLKRKEGQIVIGAAVLDDILGIVILAVVVAVVGDGAFSFGPLIRLCLAAVAFVAVALVLSRKAAPAFDWVVDRLKAPGDVAVASFLVLTVCCFAAQAIGLEAALGAFAAGLILSAPKHTHDIDAAVMMPRSEVGLIFLGLGSQAGILTPALEAAILLMVIGTTFLAPVLLRLVIPSEPSLGEEQAAEQPA